MLRSPDATPLTVSSRARRSTGSGSLDARNRAIRFGGRIATFGHRMRRNNGWVELPCDLQMGHLNRAFLSGWGADIIERSFY